MLILKSDRCPFIATTIFTYRSPTYGYENFGVTPRFFWGMCM